MTRKLRLLLMRVAVAVLEMQGPFGPAPSKYNKKVKCSYSQHS